MSLEVIDLIHRMLGESWLGRSSDSRRTVETGIRAVASHGCQVPGATPEATVAELAHVSEEPHAELGLCRFLRGSHHHLPASLCFCDSLT